MGKNVPRLGRGLDSLIGTAATSTERLSSETAEQSADPAWSIRKIPLDLIEPNPFQPREHLEEATLSELADSLKRDGLLQPIAVRQTGGKYQIIIGERRWRAARSAGLQEVPAIVRQIDDDQMLALALIENIHREDLNAIEKAQAYDQLRRMLGGSIEQLAQRLGQDRSTISNYLRLLELEEPIQSLLRAGKLTMGHARALLGAPAEHRGPLAEQIMQRGLSVRAVEQAIQRLKRTTGRPERQKRPHVRLLEQRFSEALGVRTVIQANSSANKGRIVLYYRTLDDFDRICQLLNVDLSDL